MSPPSTRPRRVRWRSRAGTSPQGWIGAPSWPPPPRCALAHGGRVGGRLIGLFARLPGQRGEAPARLLGAHDRRARSPASAFRSFRGRGPPSGRHRRRLLHGGEAASHGRPDRALRPRSQGGPRIRAWASCSWIWCSATAPTPTRPRRSWRHSGRAGGAPGVAPRVVASVTGTDTDPQNVRDARPGPRSRGVHVRPSAARAALFAGAPPGRADLQEEEQAMSLERGLELLGGPLSVIHLGWTALSRGRRPRARRCTWSTSSLRVAGSGADAVDRGASCAGPGKAPSKRRNRLALERFPRPTSRNSWAWHCPRGHPRDGRGPLPSRGPADLLGADVGPAQGRGRGRPAPRGEGQYSGGGGEARRPRAACVSTPAITTRRWADGEAWSRRRCRSGSWRIAGPGRGSAPLHAQRGARACAALRRVRGRGDRAPPFMAAEVAPVLARTSRTAAPST